MYCIYQNVSGSSQFKPVIQGLTVYQCLTEKVIILGTYNIFKIKELTVTLWYTIKLQHGLYKLLLRNKNLRNKIDLDSKPNSTSYFVILNKLLQFLCLSFLFWGYYRIKWENACKALSIVAGTQKVSCKCWLWLLNTYRVLYMHYLI